MPVQINIFLLLFGGLQGFLISIFLIRKKTFRTGYVFLNLYIVVMILQILLKVMSKVWLWENMREFYLLSYQFPLLYGPLVYLLTISLLKPGRHFQPKDMLHFIPFATALFFLFTPQGPWAGSFFQSLFFKIDNITALQLLSVPVYHIISWKIWQAHNRKVKDQLSDIRLLQMKWLRNFIVISVFVCTAIVIAIHYMYINFPHFTNIRFSFISLSVFIYWISYSAMKQPELFLVIHGKGMTNKLVIPQLVIHRHPKKYSNSGLKEEDMARIVSALDKQMTVQKPFLDPRITIDELAEKVPCSRHHLSQVLNEHYKMSFYDYINSSRIEMAKSLLADAANDNYKVASIAYDSGFNSLSSFNEVFKKMTEQTPSQFRKLQVEQSRKQRV